MKRRARVGRRTGISSGIPALLDSTYLLPVFGVEVKGVDDEVLLRLRRLAIEKLTVPILLSSITHRNHS